MQNTLKLQDTLELQFWMNVAERWTRSFALWIEKSILKRLLVWPLNNFLYFCRKGNILDIKIKNKSRGSSSSRLTKTLMMQTEMENITIWDVSCRGGGGGSFGFGLVKYFEGKTFVFHKTYAAMLQCTVKKHGNVRPNIRKTVNDRTTAWPSDSSSSCVSGSQWLLP